MNNTFRIGDVEISPGSRQTVDLPVAMLHTHTPLTMPVHVINGKREGPRLFVSAAVHGDEINGVEIIRRLLDRADIRNIHGTLIAIPIVNLFGFLQHTRYLPDRRDLNRSFPGSEKGSLAARLANILMTEIVTQCTHGIDLHTAAVHRTNLPQIRINLDDPESLRLAKAFGTPVIIHADVRDGSLREASVAQNIPMLLYEAGEALRFDEVSIRAGLRGIVNVLRELEMLPKRTRRRQPTGTVAKSTSWVRAPESGVLRFPVALGAQVTEDSVLGLVSDPFGGRDTEILAPGSGIVIGKTVIPLVNEGEAMFNIARFDDVEGAADKVKDFQEREEQAIDASENTLNS
ncbi:succinylglutamate desuccinylase/aspartoacylase family protein [Pseudomonadota bacterium]